MKKGRRETPLFYLPGSSAALLARKSGARRPPFPGTNCSVGEGGFVEQHGRTHSGEPRCDQPPLQSVGERAAFCWPQRGEAVDQILLDSPRGLPNNVCALA